MINPQTLVRSRILHDEPANGKSPTDSAGLALGELLRLLRRFSSTSVPSVSYQLTFASAQVLVRAEATATRRGYRKQQPTLSNQDGAHYLTRKEIWLVD